jgi:hypothetical protein
MFGTMYAIVTLFLFFRNERELLFLNFSIDVGRRLGGWSAFLTQYRIKLYMYVCVANPIDEKSQWRERERGWILKNFILFLF